MVQKKLIDIDKPKEVIKAVELAKKQREISVAEFFTKNRHLLGFDNPRKALLTTIKEAVDNCLDATEEMKVPPDITVMISPLDGKEASVADRFLISVEDNGPGIVKQQVPRIFAKLLYGSKFHTLRQGRGQQGIGICTSPDTLVPFANGDIQDIRNIVDGKIKNEMFVLRPDLKLSKQPVSSFFKVKAPYHVVKLCTLGGKEIELSPENPVLIKTEYGLDWKRADCISKGDYIAVARTLNVKTEEEPYTLSVINAEGLRTNNPKFVEEVIDKLRKKYGSFNKIAERFGIKKDHIRGFVKKPLMRNPELDLFIKFAKDVGYTEEDVYAKSIRVGRLGNYVNIPLKLCPMVFRFAGLVAGDGNVQKKRKDRWGQNITFWNKEQALLYDFKRIIKILFGINTKIRKDNRGRGAYVLFSSSIIADLLEKIGIPSGNKSRTFKIPQILLRLSNKHVAEYLRGLFDAEGSVSEERRAVALMITNESVLRHVSIMLLRLGIRSSLAKAKRYKRIVISGKDNVKRFKDCIGFTSPKQTAKLNRILEDIYKPHPNMMVYPKMGSCIINAEKAIGISHYALKSKYAKSKLLNNKYLSHDTLSRIFDKLKEKARENHPAELQEIYAMLDADIGWSKVTNVTFEKPKYNYVYDLRMSKGNNFIANGIVIHNSAAGMYGQLTTGKPVKITTRISPKKPAMYYELHIDTKKNEPEILKEEETEWEKDHGTRVSIELEAKYMKGRQSVEEYLKQTAIANPHAHIIYYSPENQKIEFPRVTQELPAEPKAIKPHPYGVELGMLMNMLKETRARNLQAFLKQDFSRVSPRIAKEICQKAGLFENARPSRIATQEVDKLYKAINETKIMSPPTNCLAPIGEELMLKGLKKEVNADFYAASTRSPSVYRGNPFQIECALAYGGELPSEELVRVIRFANRVPLLYQQSACATYKAILETKWRNYSISQSKGALPAAPIIIMIHMASVWVPFTSESKEAIAHYPEIIKEMKLALQECGRQLSIFINRRRRDEHEAQKKSYIEKYLPHIGIALKDILKLNENQEKKIERNLKHILEKTRE